MNIEESIRWLVASEFSWISVVALVRAENYAIRRILSHKQDQGPATGQAIGASPTQISLLTAGRLQLPADA